MTTEPVSEETFGTAVATAELGEARPATDPDVLLRCLADLG